MATLQEIVRSHHVEEVELLSWIEHRWVRPQRLPEGLQGGWLFDEVDDARVALIRELRVAFAVNDEALDIVLSLLDQLYAARRVLKNVEDAVDALPAPMREELRRRLRQDA
jgi:chaperone modulatory protein CbpM